MKDGQKEIYYISGENMEMLKNSPQIEGFKSRGLEVLFLTDTIDDFWLQQVNDYQGKAFKSVTKGTEAQQGRYSYVYGDENPSDLSSEVWSGTMEIQNVKNAPVVTIFPLPDVIGTLEPGAYFIEVTDAIELDRYEGPPASAKRWVMLTDLALTAYRSGSGLDVTLRSLRDGRVMPNTPVQLIARNNELNP